MSLASVADVIRRLGFNPSQSCSEWIAREYLESPLPDYSLDILQSGEQQFKECFYKRLYESITTRSASESNFDGQAFYLSLKKVMTGKCCIAGCEGQTELIVHDQSSAPRFCAHHISDGEDTHSGKWINVSAYHDKWTCCGSNWKLSHCPKLDAEIEPFACFIPTTQKQRDDVIEKDRADTAKREADEAFYRRLGYNNDDCYDR